ncbi:MAG: hypothetical protein Q8N99_02215 [Nanoarchaeota archaeon]|nr:hypothetical protein [Nanoarchaeota archaeon]
MDYKGVIIEESLEDKSILKEVKIIKTKIEKVTFNYRTPWLKQWTIHTIEIPEEKIDEICKKIKKAFDSEHNWYIDLKNNKYEITVFHDQIIKKRVYNYFKG